MFDLRIKIQNNIECALKSARLSVCVVSDEMWRSLKTK